MREGANGIPMGARRRSSENGSPDLSFDANRLAMAGQGRPPILLLGVSEIMARFVLTATQESPRRHPKGPGSMRRERGFRHHGADHLSRLDSEAVPLASCFRLGMLD
jgi:hypothetical protein